MANENENRIIETEQEEQRVETAADYLAQLEELKKNTVPMSEYNRLARDNKMLADSLANGGARISGEEIDTVSADEIKNLRNKLYGDDTHYRNNMNFFSDLLRLRKGIIESGEADPFLPHNRDYVPNEADEARAEYIAGQIQECLEYCAGDPHIFNVELQRRCGVKYNARGK